MSLGIYFRDSNGSLSLVSSDGDNSNPVITTHNGKDGDVSTVALFLRNSDNTKWYSNIKITPVDLIGASPYGDVAYNETGWGVKLSKGGIEPTTAEWADIDWGDHIDMDDIGADNNPDVATYHTFWYLISCPPNEGAKNKDDIVLKVEFTENAV
jgi:hypothetical protein